MQFACKSNRHAFQNKKHSNKRAANTKVQSAVGCAAQLVQTTRSALAPTAPAELSNAPAIIGAAGFNERVELKVLRPDTLASVAALSYKVWRLGVF